MGKKNLTKNGFQRVKLQEFYRRKEGRWTKADIIVFSCEIGLKKQQVYKWLWDKRNEMKKKNKMCRVEEDKKEKKKVKKQSWHEIIIGNSLIETPKERTSASRIIIHESVSEWGRNILEKQGWQLFRKEPEVYHRHPEKLIFPLRQFTTTREEIFEYDDERGDGIARRNDGTNQ